MTDRAAEIAEALLTRDGVDPLGDRAEMARALIRRFPGVTAEEIIRGYQIAQELSAMDGGIQPPPEMVQVFFGVPTLAWRCNEADRIWLAGHGRAYRVRPALDNELWALGKERPADMAALTVIRAADGAAMVFAARTPDPLLHASDATLSEHFDREIDAGIDNAARGPR